MKTRRPINAKLLFIEAVVDEMKDLDKPGGKPDPERAKALMPFVEIADTMARSRKRVSPPATKPLKEAAE